MKTRALKDRCCVRAVETEEVLAVGRDFHLTDRLKGLSFSLWLSAELSKSDPSDLKLLALERAKINLNSPWHVFHSNQHALAKFDSASQAKLVRDLDLTYTLNAEVLLYLRYFDCRLEFPD